MAMRPRTRKEQDNNNTRHQKKNRICRRARSDAVPFLPGHRQVHRLQGHRHPAEAADQPRQDLLPQAKRQLRRLPAEGQGGDQAGPLHGSAAVHDVSCIYDLLLTIWETTLASSTIRHP